jgi:hypothetical protein
LIRIRGRYKKPSRKATEKLFRINQFKQANNERTSNRQLNQNARNEAKVNMLSLRLLTEKFHEFKAQNGLNFTKREFRKRALAFNNAGGMMNDGGFGEIYEDVNMGMERQGAFFDQDEMFG